MVDSQQGEESKVLLFENPSNEQDQVINIVNTIQLEATLGIIWCLSICQTINHEREEINARIHSIDELDLYIIDLFDKTDPKPKFGEYTLLLVNYYIDQEYYKNAIRIFVNHIRKFNSSHHLLEDGLLNIENFIRFGPQFVYIVLEELYDVLSNAQKENHKELFKLFENNSNLREWIPFILSIFTDQTEDDITRRILFNSFHSTTDYNRSLSILATLCMSTLYEILFFNYECFIDNANNSLRNLSKLVIGQITNKDDILKYVHYDQISYDLLDIVSMIEQYLQIPKVKNSLQQRKLTSSLAEFDELLIFLNETIDCDVIIDQNGLQLYQFPMAFQVNSSYEYIQKQIFLRFQHKFARPSVFCLWNYIEGSLRQAKFQQLTHEVQDGQDLCIIVYEKKIIDEDELLLPVYVKGDLNGALLTYPNMINFDIQRDDFQSIKKKATSSIQNLLVNILNRMSIVANFKDILDVLNIEFILSENGAIIQESRELIEQVGNFKQLSINFIINNANIYEIVTQIESERLNEESADLPSTELKLDQIVQSQKKADSCPRFIVVEILPSGPAIHTPSKYKIGPHVYDLSCVFENQGQMQVRRASTEKYLQNYGLDFDHIYSISLGLEQQGRALYELSRSKNDEEFKNEDPEFTINFDKDETKDSNKVKDDERYYYHYEIDEQDEKEKDEKEEVNKDEGKDQEREGQADLQKICEELKNISLSKKQ